MKWVSSAARSARDREASLRVAPVGLVVVVTTLAIAGWTPALVLVSAATLLVIAGAPAVRDHRSARQERDQHFAEVAARLHHIDAEHREAQARMHAIRSIVAGIVSATQLLKSLPEDRRDSFESMVDAELDRLTRILRDETATRARPIALDDLLSPIVLSHRSRGRHVTWEPTGLSVLGLLDDVAESVNILIDNAAVHGDASDIRVGAERRGAEVVLTVTDGGPGVPAELRDEIFRWGARRAGSPGEGIGLNFAQTLVRELGGDLELDEDYRDGTRFALTLPTPEQIVPAERAERAELRIAG